MSRADGPRRARPRDVLHRRLCVGGRGLRRVQQQGAVVVVVEDEWIIRCMVDVLDMAWRCIGRRSWCPLAMIMPKAMPYQATVARKCSKSVRLARKGLPWFEKCVKAVRLV